MGRRAVTQTPADVKLLEKVYQIVEAERDDEVEKNNKRADMEIIKIIKQYEKEEK